MTSTTRLRPARDPAREPAPRLRRTPPAAVPAFRTPVRGHAFAARPPGAVAPGPGRPARLVREPDNPRDPLAVAVWVAQGTPWRLGYLDRSVAARLAPRIDDGQRFVVEFDGWVDAPDGGWRRPLLHVSSASDDLPVPPTGRDAAGPGPVPPSPLAGRPPGVARRALGPRP